MPKKRRSPKRKSVLDATVVEKLTRMLISGMGEAAVCAAAIDKLHLPSDRVDAHMTEARRQITLAADFNRDDELGKAIRRLNDCYQAARTIADIKTALACQRELNKLLRLHQPSDLANPADEEESAHLAAIRGHLQPLFDGQEPTHELARLAAAELTEYRGRR